jgi:menaquinone-9 beta-reductase
MELAARGVECRILERKVLPRTKACGSGLSPWTLELIDRLGVGPQIRAQAFRIDGAIIGGARGESIELRGDHETAILRRSELDYTLVQEACRRGAQLQDNTLVKHIDVSTDSVAVTTHEETIEADLVIDCSGATGQLERKTTFHARSSDGTTSARDARRVSSSHSRARSLLSKALPGTFTENLTLHTIMGWYQGVQGCSDVVELFFEEELRPHYAWIFPETKERVNIGLCFYPTPGSPNARERFETFIEKRIETRLRHADLLGKWIGHPVQVSTLPSALSDDRILRAGEAGALADAATAEGIYHGLLSGSTAGKVAIERLDARSTLSKAELEVYEARIKKALGARLLLGRALMGALKTPALDWALSMKSSPLTQTVLTRAFSGLYHG